MMLILGVLLVIGALVCLYLALGIFGEKESAAAIRLREATGGDFVIGGSAKLKEEDQKDSFARRLTPAGLIERAERNYLLAGRPEGWSVAKILSSKVIFGVAGLLLGFMIFNSRGGAMGTLMLLVAPLAGYFGPDIMINGRAVKRQQEIQDALPDLLDQITISIESGTSFENALARSGETGQGPLADEIVRTVQDISLGLPRRDAYEALVKRTDVEELRKFVRAIVQGEEFGVPVSEIVREQSREMRVARRLRAEGKANQVPVKMLLPLMGTILPVLFMIVIGPAIITAISQFKGGG